MTCESLGCRRSHSGRPEGAASYVRGGRFPDELAVWSGDPIAESLWPTMTSANWGLRPSGPFQPWRLRGRTTLGKGARSSPILSRFPCNYAANGLPVSACSWTLILPGSRSIRTWPA